MNYIQNMSSNKNVVYYNSNYIDVKNGGVSAWQGSRAVAEDIFLLCGTTNPTPQTGEGIIYSGNISFTDGQIYYQNVPNSLATSVYGPNYDPDTGIYNFVGSYTDIEKNTKGYIYTGRLNEIELATETNYSYPSVNKFYNIVFVHSISNGYTVGNAGNTDKGDTTAFLYKITKLKKPIEIKYPGSLTTTAYGIWYNKNNNTYTIVGGYSPDKKIPINKIYENNLILPIGKPYIVDFNPVTNTFENWTTLNLPLNIDILAHIEGISGFYGIDGVYSLSIDTINNSANLGYYAVISRDKTFGFIVTKFTEVKYEKTEPCACFKKSIGISTINSVANNNIVGLYISPQGNQSFQATILG